jgi:hypothetical protein
MQIGQMSNRNAKGYPIPKDWGGKFEDEFRRRLDNFFANKIASDPKFLSPDGKLEATYHVSVYSSDKNYWIRCFVSPLANNGVEYVVALPKLEAGKVDLYADLAQQYFSQKNFINLKQDLTSENLRAIISARVGKIIHDHRAEFEPYHIDALISERLPENTRGVFNAHVISPSQQKKTVENITLRINLRPIADYFNHTASYILLPRHLDISLLTLDTDKAKYLLSTVKPVMENLGFFEYDLSQEKRGTTERTFPLSWIDKAEISIKRGSNQSSYYLELVLPRDRKPQLKVSLNTDSAERAAKMRKAVIEEFLPQFEQNGLRYGSPLTLAIVQEFLRERFPSIPRKPTPQKPSDIRQVCVNDICKLQIYTPVLSSILRPDGSLHTQFTLRFTLPPGPGVGSDSDTNICGSLNTSDKKIAGLRLHTLRDLSEVALQNYFEGHPDVTLALTTHTRVRNGSLKPLTIFRNAKPGETAPPGEIFFADLAEQVIKPALKDFDRYISWQTEIKPAEGDKWRVTFEAMRNDGEKIPPDTSLFSGPYIVEVANKETAQQFAHDLSLEIIQKQQPFFSRERPVEKFGEASKNVVIRESLRGILQKYQSDIDVLGSNLLGQLMREKVRDK